MIIHTMRTTLVLNDNLWPEIRALAVKKGETISRFVSTLLQLGLQSVKKKGKKKLSRLPHFKTGGSYVDVSDREQIYSILDKDRVLY